MHFLYHLSKYHCVPSSTFWHMTRYVSEKAEIYLIGWLFGFFDMLTLFGLFNVEHNFFLSNHRVSNKYFYLIVICLHTVIWFHIFQSNNNNFHIIILFQVFQMIIWGQWLECLPMAQETWVQSQVESYQRLKKWYLMLL